MAGPAAVRPPSASASSPPVSVGTVRAQRRDVPVTVSATGTVVAVSSVEVRPQVTSVISRVAIREGQTVRAGQLLFTLDARAEEANVAKAQAQVARDEAGLADAQRQLARSRELLAQNFVSQGAVDAATAQVEAQSAAVAADRAALDAAKVALSFTRIVAPGSGRIGVINVFPGSAVQANQTTLLTLTQLDPIAVSFSLPQRLLPDALAALKGQGTTVTATLPDTRGALEGRLQFVDNIVDAATGTVKVKAVFRNGRSQLWPGAFVNVALTLRTLPSAVVIPLAAIVQSPRGSFVYAVRDGVTMPRPVEVLFAQGDDAAVSGVAPGERIVVEGRQNVRPGATVVERPRDGGRPAGAGGRAASAAGRAASREASR